MKLYELTEAHKELMSLEDVPPEAIADTLEAIEGDIQEKAQAIVAVRAGLESDVNAVQSEIERLTARKRQMENRDKSIRDYLKHNMQVAGITNIKCPLFSITLAKGREVVQVDDELSLPAEYVSVNTTVAPDKKKILAALKDGKEISGARLVRNEESLRIK